MVEQVDARLLKLVMERDQEREQRIRYMRAAHLLKAQNGRLRLQVQRLTRDHAVAVNRASKAEHRKP
jgi:hypothetical protein